MDLLLQQNSACADCEGSPTTLVNMQLGVFLCELCSIAHEVLKFPVRSLSSAFTPQEIHSLQEKGNSKVNAELTVFIPPWIATPIDYDLDYVRLYFAQSKYILKEFTSPPHTARQDIDLDKYWFYLDETAHEFVSVEGPVSRKYMLSLTSQLSSSGYVWHPLISKQWICLEKVRSVLEPPPGISDDTIYEACLKKQALLEHPHPHLRGYVNIVHKMKNSMKWMIILPNSLVIFPQNTSKNPDFVLKIDNLEILLQQQGAALCIELNDGLNEWHVHSTPSEIMEWFHGMMCLRHLVHNLGDEFPSPVFDESEFHICNVKSSKDFAGDKFIEGNLRKQGTVWKSRKTRWFVLRSVGLFYYIDRTDRVPHGEVRLDRDTKIECDEEELRISIITRDKFVHLWVENLEEKKNWVEALLKVVKERQSLPEMLC